MNIRNRMSDIVKLRCNACQDFLKMIIVENWEQKLYEIAFSRNNDIVYSAILGKMRDYGINQYSINDMDVTTVYEIVKDCKIIKNRVHNSTFSSLKQLKDDRNTTNHSGENEGVDYLFQRALSSLDNLERFVKTVDEKELNVDDNLRLEYRKKYIEKTTELKTTINNERSEIYTKTKNIDDDINFILESEDSLKTWLDMRDNYLNKYWILKKDYEMFDEFIVRSSNAGIVYAHVEAAMIHVRKRNIPEAEKKLELSINSIDKFDNANISGILSVINLYIEFVDKTPTNNMKHVLQIILDKGMPIEQNANGFYIIKRQKKNKQTPGLI